MATTDTRSGFRLPWSSDRAIDADEHAPSDVAAETDDDAPSDSAASEGSDPNASAEPGAQPPEPAAAGPTGPQEPAMIDLYPTAPQVQQAPRKPSKLMAELTTAIRGTAEAASEHALTQVDTDLAQVVETIRNLAKDGEASLRVRSDEDTAAIKEWSRLEIQRIKQETEAKIDARKAALDGELAAHATAIEQRVGDVSISADAFRSEMAAYAERMGQEEDPSRLATMAESMPEAPQLDAWADFDAFPLDLPAAALAVAAQTEREAALEAEAQAALQAEADAALQAEADAALRAEANAAWQAQADAAADEDGAEEPETEADSQARADMMLEPDHTAEAVTVDQVEVEAEPIVAEVEVEAEPIVAEVEVEAEPIVAEVEAQAEPIVAEVEASPPQATRTTNPWGDAESGWGSGATKAVASAIPASDDAARAAEAQAELETGLLEADDSVEPEADAALSARLSAMGFDAAYADATASLALDANGVAAGTEMLVTQVVVSGLVSVASIASFKRHLGRIGGVQAVAVASGPNGEFVFNVTHAPNVSFREALPTLPGFAARVTSTGNGVVQVTARDPESEA